MDLRTFGCKAGICGVGIFWSRFSDLQLFLLEILFPFVFVLVGFRHCDRSGEHPDRDILYDIRVAEK